MRFYAWSPPALSLGHSQSFEESADGEYCRKEGIAIIRRPTGGWAVLHDDELTYSIVASKVSSSFQGKSLLETYQSIARAFVLGLARLELRVSLIPPSEGANTDSERPLSAQSAVPCFNVPGSYEIAAPDGRKLIGSAQRRMAGAFLQHGSIPLTLDKEKLYRCTRFIEKEERDKFTSLQAIASKPLDILILQQALIEGFEEQFDATWVESRLTSEETRLASDLEANKYSTDAWNKERKYNPH